MGSYLKKKRNQAVREKYMGRRKGEIEWDKLSLIKEASKRLFSGGEKRGDERKHEAYSHTFD